MQFFGDFKSNYRFPYVPEKFFEKCMLPNIKKSHVPTTFVSVKVDESEIIHVFLCCLLSTSVPFCPLRVPFCPLLSTSRCLRLVNAFFDYWRPYQGIQAISNVRETNSNVYHCFSAYKTCQIKVRCWFIGTLDLAGVYLEPFLVLSVPLLNYGQIVLGSRPLPYDKLALSTTIRVSIRRRRTVSFRISCDGF